MQEETRERETNKRCCVSIRLPCCTAFRTFIITTMMWPRSWPMAWREYSSCEWMGWWHHVKCGHRNFMHSYAVHTQSSKSKCVIAMPSSHTHSDAHRRTRSIVTCTCGNRIIFRRCERFNQVQHILFGFGGATATSTAAPSAPAAVRTNKQKKILKKTHKI